jgi:hypothetical protein
MVRCGKTRVFYSSPLVALIDARMYMAPLFTLMSEQPAAFGCAIGTNIYTDADHFRKELRKFSHLWMEGDYGSYDTNMPYAIKWAAATVMYLIAVELGYNEFALMILRGLLTGDLHPLISMLCDLMRSIVQPSGKLGTAEFNSLIGVLMLMYAYYSEPTHVRGSFFTNVLPRTYGDDLLAAVKEDVQDTFNNQTYQKFCEEVYGIQYTSASKDLEMSKFVDINDASFLKRTFVYSEELHRFIAPLDLHSLIKCMAWIIPSKAVSKEEQVLASFNSFCWELVLHADERQYNNITSCVASELSTRYLLGYPVTVKSRQEILNQMF